MIHSFGSGLCGVQGNIHSYSKVGHWKFQGGRGGGGKQGVLWGMWKWRISETRKLFYS